MPERVTIGKFGAASDEDGKVWLKIECEVGTEPLVLELAWTPTQARAFAQVLLEKAALAERRSPETKPSTH